jgi:hypothetical protein
MRVEALFQSTRRQLLVLGGSALVGLFAFRFLREETRLPHPLQPLLRQFAYLFKEAKVDSLGQAYIDQFPTEGNPDALAQRILDEMGPSGQQVEPRELGQLMEEKILREYEEEDTVVLEGWVLSKMEGRIIALAWMFQGN